MAVIRESRGNTNYITNKYDIPERAVTFPFVMMLVCVLVDLLDVVFTLTSVGLLPWWVFTMLVFTPILITYINSRDKQFSAKGIITEMKTKQDVSSAREMARDYGNLNRESRALAAAGKIEAAAAKAEEAVRVASKFPKWMRWISTLSENIPLLELLPINSIMLFMSYLDNKSSVRVTRDTMLDIAKNPKFNINNKVTRVAGSNR
jgi:hypothetical protein